MSKQILKFATGDEIPTGAVYLNTVTQTWERYSDGWGRVWLVWHYFLVEATESHGSYELTSEHNTLGLASS